MRLVLLGCPGVGKGTQAKFITEKFNIPQISTGDILRAAVHAGSPLGKTAQEVMQAGGLVSDDIMIKLVKERLNQEDCTMGFLLDGFPRTIPQAQSLQENKIFLDFVIELKVPDEEIIKRLSGRRLHPGSGRIYHVEYHPPKVADIDDITGDALIQRKDDKEEIIRQRLRIYHEQTEPLVEYYKGSANLPNMPAYFSIDGMHSIEQIKEEIFFILEEKRVSLS